MRFLALDFETNGLPCDTWLLPCPAFPTQVSVDAFVPSTGEIVHLYDSLIPPLRRGLRLTFSASLREGYLPGWGAGSGC